MIVNVLPVGLLKFVALIGRVSMSDLSLYLIFIPIAVFSALEMFGFTELGANKSILIGLVRAYNLLTSLRSANTKRIFNRISAFFWQEIDIETCLELLGITKYQILRL
jgi:hypothetical protein